MKKIAIGIIILLYFFPLVLIAIVGAFVMQASGGYDITDTRGVRFFLRPILWADKELSRKDIGLLAPMDVARCCECKREMDDMEHNYGTPEHWCCIHCFNDAQTPNENGG